MCPDVDQPKPQDGKVKNKANLTRQLEGKLYSCYFSLTSKPAEETISALKAMILITELRF